MKVENQITGPLIKGLESISKFIDNNFKNVLKNKNKIKIYSSEK